MENRMRGAGSTFFSFYRSVAPRDDLRLIRNLLLLFWYPPSILDGSSPLIASPKPTTIRNHERRILESSPAGTARQVRLFMIIISFEQAPESTDDPYPNLPLDTPDPSPITLDLQPIALSLDT